MSNTWEDGTPKSSGNAFDWRNQPAMINWSTLQVISDNSEKATGVVTAKRAEGINPSYIGPLSKRPVRPDLAPKQTHFYSKA